jgi:protein-L-isoaspartate(D-aspartate) O-methyltransferase
MLAYFTDNHSNEELLDGLCQQESLRSKEVKDAMSKVDRADFCRNNPFEDSPQIIGYGATISAPSIHAEALELLKNNLQPGMKALDIGCGSGYLCACMAYMVGDKGKVIGIDHIKELVELSGKNVNKKHKAWLTDGVIELVHGDGRKGYPKEAPYDAIHVGAAASPQVAETLCKQLKPGGMLVIPVQDEEGEWLKSYHKSQESDDVNVMSLCPVRFISLTDQDKQLKRAF